MTIFRGELQLLRWSETSNQGATVTFQLADVRDLDAFKDLTLAKKGMVGQRIAAMMAHVEDDVEPGNEQGPIDSAPAPRPGMLCIMACTFCADPVFRAWACVDSEAEAKLFILKACRISSRKSLDTNPAAAVEFHALIREPYMAHRGKQGAAQ